MREIIAGSAVEPHAIAVFASDEPETVMLDFVQPCLARWRLLGFCWKAGRDEASGQKTHIHGRVISGRLRMEQVTALPKMGHSMLIHFPAN